MDLRRACVGLFVLFASCSPASAQPTGVVGANFQSNSSGIFIPPDTMGAIGPNNWVQYTNNGVRIFDKAGNQISSISESTFWTSPSRVGLSGATPNGDPRIIFDPLSGHWFATALGNGLVANSRVLVARSDTANPNGTWKGAIITQSPSTSLFGDFPTLGLDANGVYIGTNNFTPSGTGTFQNVSVFSIPKADLLGTNPSAFLTNMTRLQTQDANTLGFALQGVTNFNKGQAAGAPGLIYAVDLNLFDTVNVTPINGPGAAGTTLGTTTALTVATTSDPPSARQPNSGNTATSSTRLDTVDDRFGSSVYRVGDILYSAHAIGVGTGQDQRAAIRVTVLNVSNPNSPAVLAEATLGGKTAGPGLFPDPSNFDLFMPSIAANANGDIVVGYTRSGFDPDNPANSRYPSAYTSVGRLSGDTLTFGPEMELRTGVTTYSPVGDSNNPKRWGDYSATRNDPADPGIFWTTQEFALSTNTWGTQVSEIIPAVAGEVRWASVSATNATGITGNFSDPASWYNGVVPGATDHAIFSRNGDGTTPYTVTFDANATTTNDRASVRQGNVVFNIPAGSTYSLTNTNTATPSLAVAEYLGTANLTVSGGGTLRTVNATIAAGVNGEGPAASQTPNAVGNVSLGSVTVSGSTWNNTGNVYVGGSDTAAGGLGSLKVLAGGSVNIDGTLLLWRDNGATPVVTLGDAATAGTLRVGQLANAPGTVPVVSLANAGSLLQVKGDTDSTFGGTITGSGSVEKLGTGTLTLTGANTYSGGTKLTAGTIRLGTTNALPAGGTFNLAGGTLDTGGFSNALGVLQLSASSTIALGSGDHTITFAGIAATRSGLLTITGWLAPPTMNGHVQFTNIGSNPNADFASFLSTVQFAGFPQGQAFFYPVSGNAYELAPVPVPEPATVLAIAAAALGLGRLLRRAPRRPEPALAA